MSAANPRDSKLASRPENPAEQAQRDRKVVWVSAIIRDSIGRILLRQRGDRCEIDPGKWGPPGGHVEVGETLREALVRELREETALVVAPESLTPLALFDCPRGLAFAYSIEYRDLSGKVVNEPGHGRWQWVRQTSLPPHTLQSALRHYLRGEYSFLLRGQSGLELD